MKIVADSSLNITPEMMEGIDTKFIPFKITLDDKVWIDTEDLDIQEFTQAMKSSKNFSSGCPSPNDYLEAYEGDEDVLVLTITGKLSGSYNSAILAKQLYEERGEGKKNIHVFDSCSAGSAMTLIYLKMKEYIQKGVPFQELVPKVESFIKSLNTFFVSVSLENLHKAGRLSNIKAMIAKTLRITPIMGDKEGEIIMISKSRGRKKAYNKMIQLVGDFAKNFKERGMAIVHAGNIEAASMIKDKLMEFYQPKDVYITQARALNTLYADEEGVILSF